MAQAKRKATKVETGSGNVFADLGLTNPVERHAKVKLAAALQRQIQARGWSQIQAAQALGIGQPKVSALLRFRLEGFSVERLMNLLATIGHDVEITVKPRRAARGGRVSVRA